MQKGDHVKIISNHEFYPDTKTYETVVGTTGTITKMVNEVCTVWTDDGDDCYLLTTDSLERID